MEWTLTELLLNPESMNKTKSELDNIIGRDRKLEESDIDNLPYLQAVVKETLRLHPPIPFLVPRKAVKDTCFMGYNIPNDTQLLVNAWAIGRDPEVWDDPMSFKPERFIGSTVDYKGQCYGSKVGESVQGFRWLIGYFIWCWDLCFMNLIGNLRKQLLQRIWI